VTSVDTNAAVHETHVGVVILLADRANKIKNRVRTGFLDYSTPQRRSGRCAGSSNSTAGSPPTSTSASAR
jgi:aminoglycoside phosphotransferase family enzyme